MNWKLVAGRKSVEPRVRGVFRWYFRQRKEKGSFDVVVCIPKELYLQVGWTRGTKVAVVSTKQDSETIYAMIEHPQGLRLAFGGGRSNDSYLRWSKTYTGKNIDEITEEVRAFLGSGTLDSVRFGEDLSCHDGWPCVTPDKAIIFSSVKSARLPRCYA